MNNVKVVHTNEAINTSNNFQKQSPKSNPTKRCSKSTQHARRKTPTSACKSSESREAIILKSQVCIASFLRIHRIPLEHLPLIIIPRGKMLLISIIYWTWEGGVLQVFVLKGTRNEINRNDCAFYKICTFTSKECINSCKCVNTLFYPIQPIRGHCFKHHTLILFTSCRV